MIRVSHLTKLYRNGRGVRALTFSVVEGEVFGYLGPNGAGKTTTIRNLMGFLHPDSGTCSINGLDCWVESETIRRTLGYIPGELAFFNRMSGAEFIDLLSDMRRARHSKRAAGLLELFQLDPAERIREMSKGTKQKLAIVAACMHDPPIMVFDEPSSGLDPLMQDVFVEFILGEKKRGKTIFISSHNFDEISRTCDRAGILREGILADVQDVHALHEKQRRNFLVTLGSEDDVKKIQGSPLDIVNTENRRLEIVVEGNPDQFIKILSRVSVVDIELQSLALEQVFRQYYIMEGNKGLVYQRIMRAASAVLYKPDYQFKYGKGYWLYGNIDSEAFLVSSGRQVHESLAAIRKLENQGCHMQTPEGEPAPSAILGRYVLN